MWFEASALLAAGVVVIGIGLWAVWACSNGLRYTRLLLRVRRRRTRLRPGFPVVRPDAVKPAADMSSAEWAAFVERTAGSITDPTFVRPEQPPLTPVPEFD